MKLPSVFVLLVLFPILLSWNLPAIEEAIVGFDSDDSRPVFYVIVTISFLAASYIIFKNYREKANSIMWYILGVGGLIVAVFHFYLIFALSRINLGL